MPGFRIRQATPGDAAALVELARAVGSEPEGWLLTVGGWRTVADERRAIRVQRWSRDTVIVVAVATEGRIVGRLSLVRDEHPAAPHVADLGIMVAREARGQGVGTALIAAAVAWARVAAIAKVELHVFPHNVAAIALYERCGFVAEGVRAGRFLRDGRAVDALLMARPVGAHEPRERASADAAGWQYSPG